MRRDVFQAIADPTRREILGMIAHKSLNINSVSENFDVSRAAIYKHMKILAECGLLEIKQQGREHYSSELHFILKFSDDDLKPYVQHIYTSFGYDDQVHIRNDEPVLSKYI
jgi:DNA-binding transcriptional ArsR family regulator